jgi:hypothetical protein
MPKENIRNKKDRKDQKQTLKQSIDKNISSVVNAMIKLPQFLLKSAKNIAPNSRIKTEPTVHLGRINKQINNLEEIGKLILPLREKAYTESKALYETLSVDINSQKEERAYRRDVQKILDKMTYDKIEAYKDLTIIRCINGFYIKDKRDYAILDDTGMCYEVAIKTALLLQMMFPDRKYKLGQDTKRPSGWNHFFVVEEQKDSQQFIIDPSKNKMGMLAETGQWDNTNVVYKIDQLRELSNENLTPTNSIVRIKNKSIKNRVFPYLAIQEDDRLLPLLSPRHFGEGENLPPFSLCLQFHTSSLYPVLYCNKHGYVLSEDIDLDDVYSYFQRKRVNLPKPVLERILDMWKTIQDKDNFKYSLLTVDLYRKKDNVKNTIKNNVNKTINSLLKIIPVLNNKIKNKN